MVKMVEMLNVLKSIKISKYVNELNANNDPNDLMDIFMPHLLGAFYMSIKFLSILPIHPYNFIPKNFSDLLPFNVVDEN